MDLCRRLAGQDSDITVMTVIEVPRLFLDSMDEEERRSLIHDGDWESQTAELKALGYLEERGRRAVEPILAALTAVNLPVEVAFVEGADPVEAIVQTAADKQADLIIMGATKRLFTEQAWTSISSRVMERTPCPLVVIPSKTEDAPDGLSAEA